MKKKWVPLLLFLVAAGGAVLILLQSVTPIPTSDSRAVLPRAPVGGAQEIQDIPEVYGIVQNKEGIPLKEALVRAIHITSDLYQNDSGAVKTDVDGRYAHYGLLPDNQYRLVASAPGYASSSSEKFIFHNERTELNFVLQEAESSIDVKKQSPTESAKAKELAMLLSEIDNSLQKYRSGKMVFTYEIVDPPKNFSDEEIGENLRRHEQEMRKAGSSEKAITDSLDQFREFLQRKRREGSHVVCNCRHVFEGDNSYSYFFYPIPPDPENGIYTERYYKDGKETIITRRKATYPDKTQSWSSKAETRYGSPSSWRQELRNPLANLINLRELLLQGGWEMDGRGQQRDDSVSSIRNSGDSLANMVTLEVIPEKQHFIRTVRFDYKQNPLRYNVYRFENVQWDAGAGIYYPRKIIFETHDERPSDHRVDLSIITLQEFTFNIDIPDETFVVPFTEGLTVNDFRFDPPERYRHESPQQVEEYVRYLDERAAEQKKEPDS